MHVMERVYIIECTSLCCGTCLCMVGPVQISLCEALLYEVSTGIYLHIAEFSVCFQSLLCAVTHVLVLEYQEVVLPGKFLCWGKVCCVWGIFMSCGAGLHY